MIGFNVSLEQRFSSAQDPKPFLACPKRPPFDPPLLAADGPVFRVTRDGEFDSHAAMTHLQQPEGPGPALVRVVLRQGDVVVPCEGLVPFKVPILANFPRLKPSNEVLRSRMVALEGGELC